MGTTLLLASDLARGFRVGGSLGIRGSVFDAVVETGVREQRFRRALLSDEPHQCCQGCGAQWSLMNSTAFARVPWRLAILGGISCLLYVLGSVWQPPLERANHPWYFLWFSGVFAAYLLPSSPSTVRIGRYSLVLSPHRGMGLDLSCQCVMGDTGISLRRYLSL